MKLTDPPVSIALAICTLVSLGSSSLGASLTADFGGPRPNLAMFKPDETVPVIFNAVDANGQTLTVTVKDVAGTQLSSTLHSVTSNNWSTTINAYNSKLGFFRVHGTLTDGTQIAPVGSRSAGQVTYAIVPDPAQRPSSLPEDQAFFGMQGVSVVSLDVWALLGVRWYLDDSWVWKKKAPARTQPLSYAANPPARMTDATNGAGQPWPVYTMPNLTKDGRPYGGNPDVYKPNTFAYNTGALDPAFHGDWDSYCAHLAQNWPAVYPGRTQKYYEVTWEPITSWGYAGTAADLVTMYQRASAAIKGVDANAKITGPCCGTVNLGGLAWNFELLDAGLANHLDVFSAHPYMEEDIYLWGNSFCDPEVAGQPSLVATMKRRLRAAKGQDIPMIGTEQGYRTYRTTPNDHPDNEINQARRLVRSNLMLLGEGWKINTAFYFADYPHKDAYLGSHPEYWEWGFFYNMDTVAHGGYAPGKVSPKPVAAAYAAMTFLTEGRKPVNNVNWLGDTIRGYALEKYSDANDVTLVLWDFGSSHPITINAGVSSVDVYDWMGNKTTMPTSGGNVEVTISNQPIYIKGVASNFWGSLRPTTNVAQGKTVTTYDGSPGANAVDGDVWSYESRWVSPSDSNAKWLEVNLGSTVSVEGIRFFTGDYSQPGPENSWARQNVYRNALSSYRLQRWDGSTWTDIVSRTGNTKAAVNETFTPVSTSKVRLLVDAGPVSQIRLYEIQVLSSAPGSGGPNRALNKPVSTSSTYPGQPGSLAVDGNASTRWTSNATNNEWICVDLGSNYNINQVKLNWEAACGMDYTIQASTDGTNWSVLKTVTGNASAGVRDYPGLSGLGRYVCVNGTAAALWWYGYNLFEFEVYGSPAGAGETLLSSGMPASASSTYPGSAASFAVDGNPNTRWTSNTTHTEWISIDLGATRSISRIKLDWEGACGEDYTLQASSNGTAWTTLAAVTGNTAAGVHDYPGLSGTGRYVRMNGTKALYWWYGYGLFEFEVYGN